MHKLKVLSGKELVKIFESFGFEVAGQKGSHVKLKRYIEKSGEKQIITIPNHKETNKGTLKVIYNQALRYISEDNLRENFYTD